MYFFLDFYCRNVIKEHNLQSPKCPPGGGCYPTTCSVQSWIIIILYQIASALICTLPHSLFDRYKDLWGHRALFFWPGVFLHIEQSSQELSFTAMWLHKVLNRVPETVDLRMRTETNKWLKPFADYWIFNMPLLLLPGHFFCCGGV